MKEELLGLCGFGHSHGEILENRHLQEAKSACILPFLGWRIQAGELKCYHTPSREQAMKSFRRQVGESLRRDEMVRRIVAALKERKIPVIAYKGWPLANEVYPEVGGRSMSDVDLLISPAAWRESREVLAHQGFNAIKHPHHRMTLHFYHEIHLRGLDGVLMDLHRRPFPWPLFKVGYHEIKAVSRLNSFGVWIPDREALFVLVGMHAAKDAFRVPLRAILDAFVLETWGLDKDRVRAYAVNWRARRALGLWLRILLNHGLSSRWEGLSRTLAPETESLPEIQPGKWARRRVILSLQDQWWRASFLAFLRVLFRIGDAMMRVIRP